MPTHDPALPSPIPSDTMIMINVVIVYNAMKNLMTARTNDEKKGDVTSLHEGSKTGSWTPMSCLKVALGILEREGSPSMMVVAV